MRKFITLFGMNQQKSCCKYALVTPRHHHLSVPNGYNFYVFNYFECLRIEAQTFAHFIIMRPYFETRFQKLSFY